MSTVRSILHFLLRYKQFSISILALVTALILHAINFGTLGNWALGIVSIALVFPLLWDMWQNLRTGAYGIDLLAATAIVTSVLLQEYWAGIVIVIMLTGGEALEDYAEQRAKRELSALLERAPVRANLVRGHQTVSVAVSELRVNDKIIVRPGEVLPTDGVIIEGTTTLDESSITGESLPQPKKPHDNVLSGALNIDGAITLRCTATAKNSQYEQIIKLVRAAQHSQAPFVRMADRYSVPFTIAAFSIALGAWALSGESMRFLQVIVVATPCPLILAAPIAIISGMSRAAKHGIIVRTGSALEKLARAQTIGFDKTGTLTSGILRVEKVVSFASFDNKQLLTFAASVAQKSNHVLSKALVEKATASKLPLAKLSTAQEASGQGITGRIGKQKVAIGRFEFVAKDAEIPQSFNANKVEHTATFVSINGKLAGYVTFTDTVRPESKATITKLKRLGLTQIMMLTGDRKTQANTIAKQLGITDVSAQMLPADKLRVVETVAQRPVAFVGDGINDAPVLTASDVGIALGTHGSTAASEAADIVILQDDISKVSRVTEIARHTFKIARQSIFIGIGLSVILMGIFATGHFPPLAGAIIQEVVDVIVIANALRAHGSFAQQTEA